MRKPIEDKGVDDMAHKEEFKVARRILFALKHPDCPVYILDDEASRLSRHIAIRLSRRWLLSAEKNDNLGE